MSILSTKELLAWYKKNRNQVKNELENEAIKVANHFAELISQTFQSEINTAWIESEKDPEVKIPTWINAQLLIKNKALLTIWWINNINQHVLSILTSKGFEAKEKRKAPDVITHQELSIQVKIPQKELSENWLNEYIINVWQLSEEKNESKRIIHKSNWKIEIDYVWIAEESVKTWDMIPLWWINIEKDRQDIWSWMVGM